MDSNAISRFDSLITHRCVIRREMVNSNNLYIMCYSFRGTVYKQRPSFDRLFDMMDRVHIFIAIDLDRRGQAYT